MDCPWLISATSFFELDTYGRTRGHLLKLKKGRVSTDLRQHFFTERVVNIWNSLADSVVQSQSLNSFKSSLQREYNKDKSSFGRLLFDWLQRLILNWWGLNPVSYTVSYRTCWYFQAAVTVSSDYSWEAQINTICAKVAQVNGSITWNSWNALGYLRMTKDLLYFYLTVMIPVLEHGCAVCVTMAWLLHSHKNWSLCRREPWKSSTKLYVICRMILYVRAIHAT